MIALLFEARSPHVSRRHATGNDSQRYTRDKPDPTTGQYRANIDEPWHDEDHTDGESYPERSRGQSTPQTDRREQSHEPQQVENPPPLGHDPDRVHQKRPRLGDVEAEFARHPFPQLHAVL